MSLKGIFVNVEVLESLHRTFLSDLQQQMEQWSPEVESPGLSSVILSLVPLRAFPVFLSLRSFLRFRSSHHCTTQ